jgi:hypothetical protein
MARRATPTRLPTLPPDDSRFFADLACAGGGGELNAGDLPGARLRLRSRGRPLRRSLQANKNRPAARSRFEAEVHEEQDGISISRHVLLHAGAGAFAHEPLLRVATLQPPPFSGQASFHRDAVAADRWTGNLKVDLPGRSNVPLMGAGVRATLVGGGKGVALSHDAPRPTGRCSPPARGRIDVSVQTRNRRSPRAGIQLHRPRSLAPDLRAALAPVAQPL